MNPKTAKALDLEVPLMLLTLIAAALSAQQQSQDNADQCQRRNSKSQ
jgi:hypothetical protein